MMWAEFLDKSDDMVEFGSHVCRKSLKFFHHRPA